MNKINVSDKMVKHERDRSRSPVSRDRKKRARDGSPSDRSHQHRRQHGDIESRHARGDRSSSNSPSPDAHRHRKPSNRPIERQRNDRREESGHQREDHSRFDPHRRIKQEPADSHQEQSREQRRERQRNDDRRREARQQRELESGENNFGQASGEEDASSAAEKEKPNFELSGKLTEDTNTFRGVVIKYNEPAEARKPKRRWRLYGFKGEESLPMLPIHRQSAYLLGRDRRVADIPVDHPSCSKQHAVVQYRLTEFTRPDGKVGRKVRPYIIDLGSANGTYVNNQRIEAQRYMELFERDLIKFGFSSREYVLLHENVDTSEVGNGSDSD